MELLNSLIGLSVCRVVNVYDYIQIIFSGGEVLSIFNSYNYSGSSISRIERKIIINIEKKNNKIIIKFNNKECLIIGIADDDYRGPEAFTLKKGNDPPLVF